jgi:malonyl-CoA/methylmalonyl-CoA synthetase
MTSDSLNRCFGRSFSGHSGKKAISFYRGDALETEVSFRDLEEDSNRIANSFLEMGITQGDRVILYLDKSLIFLVAYLALQKIGAIAVPLNPGFKESEMDYLLRDSKACLVLCGAVQETTVRAVDPEARILAVDTESPYQELDLFRAASEKDPGTGLRPEDPAIIIYTSGTTGTPKGAVLTHGNLVHDAKNIIDIWEITESDVLCHALPLFHVHGLCFALHTAFMTGSRVVMLDRFSAHRVVDHLTRKEIGRACSVFMSVPQMYVKLMDSIGEGKFDFEHVRLWTSGSAPLPAKDFERIKRTFGKEPVEREGMSETGMNFSNPYRGVKKPGSIGLPLPRLKARIVDPETFRDVNPGQEGELWLKGPSITPGYWRNPEETAKAFEDGWFRSGDLGKVDEDGYFYITDRLKHIIISGGENISPKEIQGIINKLDGVAESAVVGVPDEQWGERVVASVVVSAGARLTEDEIRSHCKKHLHDWKCPKDILFVENLPRNTMGKVLNEEIKRLFVP